MWCQVMHGRRFPRRYFDMANSSGVTLALMLQCSLKDVLRFFDSSRHGHNDNNTSRSDD